VANKRYKEYSVRRIALFFVVAMLLCPKGGYCGNVSNQFDLHVIVPHQFSTISLDFDSPIQRYIEGYSTGFKEALKKYSKSQEMKPEKVSGWGEFISGHYDGFRNASMQIKELQKTMGKRALDKYVKELLED
jgi:hypothetical protein